MRRPFPVLNPSASGRVRTGRAGETARRIARLQELTAGLATARTVDDVARVIVDQGVNTLGAATGVFLVPDGPNLVIRAAKGLPPPVFERLRVIRQQDAYPSAIAFRTGEAEWIEDDAQYAERYPELANVTGQKGAMASLPLCADGRTLGAVVFRFTEGRALPEGERSLMRTFVALAAQALFRAQLFAAETETRRRLESLAALADALAAALDQAEVARVIVERGTAAMGADTCVLYVLSEEEGTLDLVASHGIAATLRLAAARFDHGSDVYARAKAGESTFVENEVEYARHAPALASMPERRTQAFWSVPLFAENEPIGLVAMAYTEPRRFDEESRAFVATFTRQCAQALRRSQRWEREQNARRDAAKLFVAEQRARQAADLANRAKDEFLATVSHELRTPLNAILGWSRMMATDPIDETQRTRALSTIERNATSMAQLIEDLLDVSRIVSGKMRLDIASTDARRVVEAAIEALRLAADAKAITVSATYDEGLLPLAADGGRLQQVVWNLLSNAVKFTPKRGRVDVAVRKLDTAIKLAVTDNGRGIDPAFLPYVFEPFRQADGSTTRTHGGLGLGLAIARHIVEMHGGVVSVESGGLDQGATFTVELPCSDLKARTSPRVASSVARGGDLPPRLDGIHVLAVDDDEDARTLLGEMLSRSGARVTLAESCDDALMAMAREVPDVLVSDIGMPGKDGFDLIERVRALPPEAGGLIPAAALTAYTRVEDRRRMLASGYSAHVAKPVDSLELLRALLSLVEGVAAT